jgi:hypothetical protein
VEIHGSRLSLESEVGSDNCFFRKLPDASAPEKEADPTDEGTAEFRGTRVETDVLASQLSSLLGEHTGFTLFNNRGSWKRIVVATPLVQRQGGGSQRALGNTQSANSNPR